MDTYAKDGKDEQPEEPAQYSTPEEAQAAAEAEQASKDAETVRIAKERHRLAVNATSSWRSESLEDLQFLAGEQWDEKTKIERENDGRPALTINRLPQFVRQVTNEQRQSKPSITVSPMDAMGDKKTAEVLQGVIRNIEYTSNADAAYAAAGQSAAATGLGYWDVCAEYESERSFGQRLTIRRIPNPHSVALDPGAKELAGDDARWGFISTDISKAEWEAKYPDKDAPISNGGWEGEGDAAADWVAKEGVRIHEYRCIEEEEDTLIDISGARPELKIVLHGDGIDISSGTVLASEVGPKLARELQEEDKLPTRPTTKRKVCWYKIAGEEIIDSGVLAGQYLQIVRVVGTEIEINGRTIYEGVIRHAKDPQKILNFSATAEIEAIALTPKAPWLMAEGQDEGYEEEWREANKRPLSRLRYRLKAIGGTLAPPPQRVQAEANISAITTARQQSGQDLSDVTGIYPTQFGAPAPEQSGRAILARQSQGQTSNFHFTDNLAAAIRYTGRICLDLIPTIYSDREVLRIVGEDGTQEMVPVNGHIGDFRGERTSIQLKRGKYDAACSMGPSYLSRRQEAAAQTMELLKINPNMFTIVGDLVVANMDIPGGDQIVDRLRKVLPPEIRPPDPEKQPPPAILQAQLQQAMSQNQQYAQAIDQLIAALHNAHDRVDSKEQEMASKERIALIGNQTDLVKAAMQSQSAESLEMLRQTADLIHKRLELAAVNQPMDDTSTTEAPRVAPPTPDPPVKTDASPLLQFFSRLKGAANAARPQPGAAAGLGPGAPGPGIGPAAPGAITGIPGGGPIGGSGIPGG